jgi:hypothetical protein
MRSELRTSERIWYSSHSKNLNFGKGEGFAETNILRKSERESNQITSDVKSDVLYKQQQILFHVKFSHTSVTHAHTPTNK